MHRSTIRWTTAAAVAALLAFPVAGSAQTPTHAAAVAAGAAAGPHAAAATTACRDAAAAARDGGSGRRDRREKAPQRGARGTQPGHVDARGREASRRLAHAGVAADRELQRADHHAGELARAYAKIDANLTSLLGPDSGDPAPASTATTGTAGTAGTAGATGTTGSTAAGAASSNPAISTKLVEFRSHLKLFEKAAGGGATGSRMPCRRAPRPGPPPTRRTRRPARLPRTRTRRARVRRIRPRQLRPAAVFRRRGRDQRRNTVAYDYDGAGRSGEGRRAGGPVGSRQAPRRDQRS